MLMLFAVVSTVLSLNSAEEKIEHVSNESLPFTLLAEQIAFETIQVQQLDMVIQQNASSSEEMASIAEELSSQSEALEGIISSFKVDLKGYRAQEVSKVINFSRPLSAGEMTSLFESQSFEASDSTPLSCRWLGSYWTINTRHSLRS